jgi:hypothetical protein
MDADDIRDLIAVVQAVDNREGSDADVIVWLHMLGHLDKDDCAEAIMWHRAEKPGVWLEPGHVLQRVRAVRADRLSRMSPDERDAHTRAAGAPRDEFGYVDKSGPDYVPTAAVSGVFR